MNLHLFLIFGIFLHNNFSTESRKVTPQGTVYEAFKGDAFRRITTHLIETHIVDKLGSCAFRCLKNLDCVSFNFGNPTNGTHVCELLRTDKYNSRSSLVTSTDFHYFYPVIVIELYHLLEKVDRESQHMHHIETICDFLYHIKYMFIGDLVRDEVQKIIPKLRQSLQVRLRFMLQSSVKREETTE